MSFQNKSRDDCLTFTRKYRTRKDIIYRSDIKILHFIHHSTDKDPHKHGRNEYVGIWEDIKDKVITELERIQKRYNLRISEDPAKLKLMKELSQLKKSYIEDTKSITMYNSQKLFDSFEHILNEKRVDERDIHLENFKICCHNIRNMEIENDSMRTIYIELHEKKWIIEKDGLKYLNNVPPYDFLSKCNDIYRYNILINIILKQFVNKGWVSLDEGLPNGIFHDTPNEGIQFLLEKINEEVPEKKDYNKLKKDHNKLKNDYEKMKRELTEMKDKYMKISQ